MREGREDDAFKEKKISCLRCGERSFQAKFIKLKVKGKDLEATAWVCCYCREPLMDSFQMNELLRKAR
jgi:ribosomal protein S27AE